MKSFGRGPDLLVAVAVAALIPWLSGVAANQLSPIEDSIDPAGAFAYVTVHHVSQLLLTLVLMKAFVGTTLATWGFNLHEWRRSLRITGWFCLVYLGPVFLANVLPHLVSGTVPQFDHPLTATNIGGHLGFQFFLSGSCEEPLFRGFMITFLAQSWTGRFRVGRATISSAALWATFFFMAGHAQIGLHPFSFHVSLPQQIWSLGLGLYYAVVFERTKSLLSPILSHGYSNGVIFVVLYAWALLAR
jgi:CAAX protease family protein